MAIRGDKAKLKKVHCGACKTNYWRHPNNPKPEKCGVCGHEGAMQEGHVVVKHRAQAKKIRH